MTTQIWIEIEHADGTTDREHFESDDIRRITGPAKRWIDNSADNKEGFRP